MRTLLRQVARVYYHRGLYELNAVGARVATRAVIFTQLPAMTDIQRYFTKKAHWHRLAAIQVTCICPSVRTADMVEVHGSIRDWHKPSCPAIAGLPVVQREFPIIPPNACECGSTTGAHKVTCPVFKAYLA